MGRLSRNRFNGRRAIAEINVTPLVDVVLVLLIIFMVTAPMLQMGIDVDLPRVRAKSIDVHEEKLILTINQQQEIFIDREKTSLPELKGTLEKVFGRRIDREVFMRADKNIPYGFVVQVMAEARKAGVDKLGMITDPPEAAK